MGCRAILLRLSSFITSRQRRKGRRLLCTKHGLTTFSSYTCRKEIWSNHTIVTESTPLCESFSVKGLLSEEVQVFVGPEVAIVSDTQKGMRSIYQRLSLMQANISWPKTMRLGRSASFSSW